MVDVSPVVLVRFWPALRPQGNTGTTSVWQRGKEDAQLQEPILRLSACDDTNNTGTTSSYWDNSGASLLRENSKSSLAQHSSRRLLARYADHIILIAFWVIYEHGSGRVVQDRNSLLLSVCCCRRGQPAVQQWA